MVSATSRMVSAISLGVFWRLALSTIAIMRSTKVSPGFAVTRTTIQSDSTRVPPVTAEKSPPDSRITGADSPVMALSSTDATPSITSPSAGITSPASTSTMSPLRRSSDSSGCHFSPCAGTRRIGTSIRLAQVCFFSARSDAACALLRPSASASAKLANSTVNHSHSAIARMKPAGASPLPPRACTQQQRGDDAADVDDEHHRVAPLHGGRQLLERLDDRRFDQRRIEECECLASHGRLTSRTSGARRTDPSSVAGM